MARNLGPQELDPLESAATPIMADQDVRDLTELRRRTAAYVNAGMPAGAAQRQAASDMAAGASLANNPRTKARHAAEQAAAEAAAAQEQAGIEAARPENQLRTPEELRAKGLFGQREPGVRGIDGLPVDPGADLTTEREAADYVTRQPISPTGIEFRRRGMLSGDRTARYEPSQRDKDMMARGFQPVWNEDGTVGYSVAAPVEENIPIPGAPGRRGLRRDLEAPLMRDGKEVLDKDGNPVPMYEAQPTQGPLGTSYVYRPSEATRQYNADLRRAQSLRRLAKAAGMSSAEMAKMTPEQRRMAVSDARDSRARELSDRMRAVGMLTGGRPSWGPNGSGTAANLFLSMPDDWRNAVAAQRLAPSMDGTTPLTVEAQSARNALRLLNAEALSGMFNQAGNSMAQHKIEQERRSEMAAHEERLANNYAPTSYMGFGYNEFEPDEQQAMYDELRGLGASHEEAARAVDRQAVNRRATHRRFGPAGPTKPAPAQTEGGETIGIN